MNRQLRVVIATLLGSATLASAAYADEKPAIGNVLDEIVVTAQKREEKLQNVPIAITVVGEQQLASEHINTIADLSRTAPSLEMIQAFGGPGGGGQIRGVGTQSFTRSAEGAVGIVVDGVPQGNVPSNNIYDIARVEVLRGPQGTLFGLTASAGVINMVTVAPDPTKFSANVHLEVANKGTGGSKFGEDIVRGAVNFPLGDRSALRISANGNFVKGVQNNAFNGEDNVLHDGGVRARYLWNASDSLTVNLIADYDHRTQNYGDPQFTYVDVPAGSPLATQLAACGITASYANQSRCSNLSNNSAVKNYGFSAQLDWQLGAGTLTSISAYRKNEQSPSNVDIMGNPQEFSQIFFTGQVNAARQVSQELRFSSASDATLEYTAGLFYSDYAATSGYENGGAFQVGTYQLAPFFINFVKDASSTETTNKASAAFGQLTYHVNDKLGLIAGARYTHQSLTDYQSTNPNDPTSVAVSGDVSVSNVSGKVGVNYQFDPNLTGYATITRGYKGPQVNPASQGSPATIVNAELPTAYESGLKGSTLEGRLGFDVGVFYTKVKDYQGQRCSINPVGSLACTGESVPSITTQGVEIDLFGRPLDGLTVNAGAIYDKATFPSGWTGYNPDDLRPAIPGTLIGQTDMSGLQLVGVSKVKGTLSAEYGHALGGMEGFIGADTVYKSSMRLAYSADSRFVYPAHWMTSARIGIRDPGRKWSAELFARNLSNEHEPATLFGGPSFLPPGVVPFVPNGMVNGISGWVTSASLRLVGISLDVKF